MPNANFPLRDKGFSNALTLDEFPRHRWYFVKEGFSPKIVEEAINTDGVLPGEVILDPFSGGGTVPLTGALCGLQARGFEINPFLSFISSTKLCQVPPEKFCAATRQLLLALKKPTPSALEGFSTFTKGNAWGRWLFPRSVVRCFESGQRALANIDLQLRDLLEMALIGAAMDCCNATRDGKCLRYIKDWRKNEASGSLFRKHFKQRAEIIATDLKSTPLKGKQASILKGDARQLISSPSLEKFRLCVTSPPYLNSFDYSDIYRPELFLGGFVDSNKSLMNIRLKTVRSHVQASWERPRKDDFGILYNDCIGKIRENTDDLWDRRIPTMVQAYFEDMEVILRGLRLRAHDNASMWLVVSTSAYAGVEVPVDLILAEIGQRAGWFLREVGVLRYLRSSSQHYKREENRSVPLRESVVILDASKRRSR
jgi:hypothetical protein